MKRRLVVLGWLVFSALGPGCTGGGGGGPVSSPINPFGTEPALTTGSEPTGGGNEAPSPGGAGASIGELCAQACVHIESMCPGASGSNCVADCATIDPGGCEAEIRAFLVCFGTAPLNCNGGQLSASACNEAVFALQSCESANPAP